MFKIDINNISIYTILSLLCLFGGIIYYLYWGFRYGVWADIGIYSITIVFVIAGLVGTILTLYEKESD